MHRTRNMCTTLDTYCKNVCTWYTFSMSATNVWLRESLRSTPPRRGFTLPRTGTLSACSPHPNLVINLVIRQYLVACPRGTFIASSEDPLRHLPRCNLASIGQRVFGHYGILVFFLRFLLPVRFVRFLFINRTWKHVSIYGMLDACAHWVAVWRAAALIKTFNLELAPVLHTAPQSGRVFWRTKTENSREYKENRENRAGSHMRVGSFRCPKKRGRQMMTFTMLRTIGHAGSTEKKWTTIYTAYMNICSHTHTSRCPQVCDQKHCWEVFCER